MSAKQHVRRQIKSVIQKEIQKDFKVCEVKQRWNERKKIKRIAVWWPDYHLSKLWGPEHVWRRKTQGETGTQD